MHLKSIKCYKYYFFLKKCCKYPIKRRKPPKKQKKTSKNRRFLIGILKNLFFTYFLLFFSLLHHLTHFALEFILLFRLLLILLYLGMDLVIIQDELFDRQHNKDGNQVRYKIIQTQATRIVVKEEQHHKWH